MAKVYVKRNENVKDIKEGFRNFFKFRTDVPSDFVLIELINSYKHLKDNEKEGLQSVILSDDMAIMLERMAERMFLKFKVEFLSQILTT